MLSSFVWPSNPNHLLPCVADGGDTRDRARVRTVVARFTTAGAADGTIRTDVEPDDVTLILAGAVLITAATTDASQLHRLLDLLLNGLRAVDRASRSAVIENDSKSR